MPGGLFSCFRRSGKQKCGDENGRNPDNPNDIYESIEDGPSKKSKKEKKCKRVKPVENDECDLYDDVSDLDTSTAKKENKREQRDEGNSSDGDMEMVDNVAYEPFRPRWLPRPDTYHFEHPTKKDCNIKSEEKITNDDSYSVVEITPNKYNTDNYVDRKQGERDTKISEEKNILEDEEVIATPSRRRKLANTLPPRFTGFDKIALSAATRGKELLERRQTDESSRLKESDSDTELSSESNEKECEEGSASQYRGGDLKESKNGLPDRSRGFDKIAYVAATRGKELLERRRKISAPLLGLRKESNNVIELSNEHNDNRNEEGTFSPHREGDLEESKNGLLECSRGFDKIAYVAATRGKELSERRRITSEPSPRKETDNDVELSNERNDKENEMGFSPLDAGDDFEEREDGLLDGNRVSDSEPESDGENNLNSVNDNQMGSGTEEIYANDAQEIEDIYDDISSISTENLITAKEVGTEASENIDFTKTEEQPAIDLQSSIYATFTYEESKVDALEQNGELKIAMLVDAVEKTKEICEKVTPEAGEQVDVCNDTSILTSVGATSVGATSVGATSVVVKELGEGVETSQGQGKSNFTIFTAESFMKIEHEVAEHGHLDNDEVMHIPAKPSKMKTIRRFSL